MARTDAKICPAAAISSGAGLKLLMAVFAPSDQKVILKQTSIPGKAVTAATPVELTFVVGTLSGAGTGSTSLTPPNANLSDSTVPRVTAKHSYTTEPTHAATPTTVKRAAFPPTLGYFSRDEIVIPANKCLFIYTNAGTAVDLVPDLTTEE